MVHVLDFRLVGLSVCLFRAAVIPAAVSIPCVSHTHTMDVCSAVGKMNFATLHTNTRMIGSFIYLLCRCCCGDSIAASAGLTVVRTSVRVSASDREVAVAAV